ncbi:MAG: RNA polymerase sigma factor [Planctomycetota bacterium]|jgi:RNA polymerase sigma factor (sigma-70 family)
MLGENRQPTSSGISSETQGVAQWFGNGDPQTEAEIASELDALRRAATAYCFVYKLGAEVGASDLAQSTFIRTWQQLKEESQGGERYFVSKKHFRSYLKRVLRNRAIDWARRPKAVALRLDRAVDRGKRPDQEVEQKEQEMADNKRSEEISRAVTSSDHRILVDRAHGKPWREIGEDHGLQPDAARKRHSRIIGILRRVLGRTG